MRLAICGSLIAAGIALTVPAAAQDVPTRTLSRPAAEFAEPFTQVAGVRELGDGRVVVADPRDKIVQVIDFRSGSAQAIGREGSGPGEYAMPISLFAFPGDTSGVLDPLNRRMLLITPEAKPGAFVDITPPSTGRAGGGPGIMMMGNIIAVDNRGRFYLRGTPFRIVDGAPQPADSVPIERWDRASGRRDTVAYLPVPSGTASFSGSAGRVSMRIGPSGPFAAQDLVAVTPDGRVAIIHADPFRVDFVDANGTRTQGQPIRHDRIRLSEGHKQQWRDQQRTATRVMMTNDNGRMSARMVPGGDIQEPATWPDYLPPFLANAAIFAPDGRLWLRRTTAANAPPTYDVIDGNGRVVERVVLPQRSRVVGFGNGSVYVTRSDEDDLQYLQRFTLPAGGRM